MSDDGREKWVAPNPRGPQTREGLEKVVKGNLALGPRANSTHGAHGWVSSGLAPSCDKCLVRERCEEYAEGGECGPAQREREAIYTSLMAMAHITPAHDVVVRQFATLTVALDICDRYLSVHGVFQRDSAGLVNIMPLVSQRDRWAAQVMALAGQLGLTPAAAARMKVEKGGNALDAISEALATLTGRDAERAKRQEQLTMEGDWEDGDG